MQKKQRSKMTDAQQTTKTNQTQSEQNPSAEKIHVIVRNRNSILFDNDVKSITSKNDTGIFDILPEHSNFISLISSPLILRTADGQKKEITFKNGLIKVKDNAIHCYVDLLAK
jgi:F0F1-type ATP synthase epsilon subunit